MLFNECSEEEQQKEPVYILSEDAFDKRVKTSSRLTYSLYVSMRKLQNVKEKNDTIIYVLEDGETWFGDAPIRLRLTQSQFEEVDGGSKPYKCDWYGTLVKEEKLADISEEQLAEIIKLVPEESKGKLDAILKK